jgi:hypothetical protein
MQHPGWRLIVIGNLIALIGCVVGQAASLPIGLRF